VTYTLGSNVEDLELIGTNAIDGTGNELDNTITGNGKANTLRGQDGVDEIHGGLGDDRLFGATKTTSCTAKGQ